jgi:ribosomal protein S18 acetylase RimI-like enzyme
VVRLAGPDDAAALLALQHRLDLQTSSMLLEPQERGTSPGALRDRLAAQTQVGSYDLLAVAQGELLGWSAVEVLPYRRAAATGYVVIGVDAVASGRGVGSALLTAAREQASARGLHRLELTVMTDNTRAVSLYRRHGYDVEGVRRRALIRNGVVVDEYYMGCLLDCVQSGHAPPVPPGVSTKPVR